jgi:arylsulfatase A-like enzyme
VDEQFPAVRAGTLLPIVAGLLRVGQMSALQVSLTFFAASTLIACGGTSEKPVDPKLAVAPQGKSPAEASARPRLPVTQAPSRGPEVALYSLADNRLAAHLYRDGGLVLAAGSAGFAKYVRFGNTLNKTTTSWLLRQNRDSIRVARMTGSSAAVEVPVRVAAEVSTVRLRAFSEKPGSRPIGLRVNGNKDLNGQLVAGWSTVEFTVPAGQLRDGENSLQFFVGGPGLDVEWIQIGGALLTSPAANFWSEADKRLLLPDGGGMSWYVMIPDKARLAGDLDDGACAVEITATPESGAAVHGSLSGKGSAVDLVALSGKAARLDLVAKGCSQAKLAGAALVVPGDAPVVKRGEAPRYVVLFVMDSLRADRVRPFNRGARPETPMWDQLAETGASFLQHYVQGNESRVSHASLWSALYPIKHRMIGEKDQLAAAWTTIDEVARKAGRFVAGVSSNGYIRPARGFGSAWDKYSNHIEEKLGLKGEDILSKGLSFITGKTDPWFLYLGTIDTHVSWRSKEPWMSKYDPGYKGRFADTFGGDDAGKVASGALKLTPREIEHVRAIYDSNVSYQDELLRKLVDKLKEWKMWEQTMLIITADHGDEQWEEGRVGHGASTRDMLIHVPLFIHYPPLIGAGKFTEGTELVDVVPTVADALGLALDPEWQGASLVPLSQGVGRGYPRMSFNSMYENQHAGRIGAWKVRVSGAGQSRVFHFASDPEERTDLSGKPEAAIGARLVLDPLWMMRQWNREWKKSQWGNAANVSARFAADLGE